MLYQSFRDSNQLVANSKALQGKYESQSVPLDPESHNPSITYSGHRTRNAHSAPTNTLSIRHLFIEHITRPIHKTDTQAEARCIKARCHSLSSSLSSEVRSPGWGMGRQWAGGPRGRLPSDMSPTSSSSSLYDSDR